MGTCTIGVSIAVPEPYGSLLQQRRAAFGDPQAFAIPTHVTLLPPTEVEPSSLSAIEAHLAEVATHTGPFEMRLAGTDTFRPLSPVVFVKIVQGAEECTDLQLRVRSGPVERELQFPYHPHVTVAHGIADHALDQAHDALGGFTAGWCAQGFALYEQGEDGVWRLQREYAFGAAALLPHQPGPVDVASSTRR